jgi:hypothetical protein
MDIAFGSQEPRCPEDNLRIVGKAQIAGEADDEAGGDSLTKWIVRADGTVGGR